MDLYTLHSLDLVDSELPLAIGVLAIHLGSCRRPLIVRLCRDDSILATPLCHSTLASFYFGFAIGTRVSLDSHSRGFRYFLFRVIDVSLFMEFFFIHVFT